MSHRPRTCLLSRPGTQRLRAASRLASAHPDFRLARGGPVRFLVTVWRAALATVAAAAIMPGWPGHLPTRCAGSGSGFLRWRRTGSTHAADDYDRDRYREPRDGRAAWCSAVGLLPGSSAVGPVSRSCAQPSRDPVRSSTFRRSALRARAWVIVSCAGFRASAAGCGQLARALQAAPASLRHGYLPPLSYRLITGEAWRG